MKKAVIITTILCSGLLIGGSFNNTINAQDLKLNKTVQKVNSLTQEDALNFLKQINSKLEYSYIGDENIFKPLKEKGLKGYVFIPNIPTDLGYFVDKETKEVYYFHPSGYLELIK